MPIYRIFPILLDYQRLRPVDADQAPREAHQLSVERLEHLEGSGRPSGRAHDSPAKHGLGQHPGHSFEAIVSYHFLITDTDL